MKEQSYTATIKVPATAEEAYAALTTGFDKWWTTPDKVFTKIGDVAKFTFPPNPGYWVFKATKLQPFRLVEMQCVEARHIHEGEPEAIKEEWLGTTVRWEIKAENDGTEITITHKGLQPNLLCYKICIAGWDHFFVHSLPALLSKGIGKPHIPSQF